MWPSTQRRNSAKAVIDHAIHEAILVAGADSGTRKAFEHLLQHVRVRTSLLRLPTLGGRIETRGIRQIITGLLALRPITRIGCAQSKAGPRLTTVHIPSSDR